jgi:hypothetical protein
MKHYVEWKREFKTLEKSSLSPERLDLRFGLTQDGGICVMFGKPVPDLLFTPQEAVAFVEAMQKLIAAAKKIRPGKNLKSASV